MISLRCPVLLSALSALLVGCGGGRSDLEVENDFGNTGFGGALANTGGKATVTGGTWAYGGSKVFYTGGNQGVGGAKFTGGFATGGSKVVPTGGKGTGGATTGGRTGVGGVGGIGGKTATGGSLTGGFGGVGGKTAPSGGTSKGGTSPLGGSTFVGGAGGTLTGGAGGTAGSLTAGATGFAGGGGIFTGGTAAIGGSNPLGGADAGFDTGGTSSSGGSSSMGGSSNTGGISGTGGTSACPLFVLATEELIDDMDDGTATIPEINGRRGAWSDALIDTNGASMVPDPSTAFFVTDTGDTCHKFAVYVHGQTSVDAGSGANFGFSLGSPYDASAYTGFSFWAKIDPGTNSPVRLAFPDWDTDPRGAICQTSTTDPSLQCWSHFGIRLSLSTNWTKYIIPFTALTQDPWGYHPAAFDPSRLFGVVFQIAENDTFGIWVDSVAFTK